MPDFLRLLSERPELLFYICVAGAVIFAIEGIGLAIGRSRSGRKKINKRLELLAGNGNRDEVLVQLRRERGLTEDGSFSFKMVALNRLLLQAGVGSRGRVGWAISIPVIAILFAVVLTYFWPALLAVPAGLLAGVGIPLLVLRQLRNRRRARFAEQLPEALDVMVRSMRAGHPIAVAVALVGRELPDPIGTEFGICADEMTYGLDLETALHNMTVRVGQEDLPFVVVAVSIQSKTGGNLAEVLSNLSRVIRDRFKLRRRVKAMSAEGRMSAGALSLIPLLVFLAVNFLAPSFYSEVKYDPLIVPVATLTFLLWATGIFVIYRLVNFKY